MQKFTLRIGKRVHRFGRRLRACQKSCGNSGYIFGACERNDGAAIAPKQERGVLLGYAAADKSDCRSWAPIRDGQREE